MSNFLILAFLFFIGCIFGWGIEVLFRRYFTNRELKIWINPGFLIGPYLPIYGIGLCILYAMAKLESCISSKALLFLIMAIVLTCLEYIAGLFFIKLLHVKLWDYSDMRFNVQGIICPLFSLFWAMLGAIYYFLVHPHVLEALEWLSNNLAFSFFVGMFYGIFIIDLVYSFRLVARVKAFAKEKQIVIKYELLKQEIRERAKEGREKLPFFVPIVSPNQVKEHLVKYIELELAFHDK